MNSLLQPKREPVRVLEEIGKAMLLFPELRIGQLLVDVMREGDNPFPSLFYVEDGVLAARIEQFIQEHKCR